MLLRSSSTPILNTWIPHSKESSPPEVEIAPKIPRTKSITLTTWSPSPSHSLKRMTRALSETDLPSLPVPTKRPVATNILNGLALEEKKDEMETASFHDGWFSSPGMVKEGCEVGVLVGGGKMCGGGGGGGGCGGDGRWGSSEFNNRGKDNIDAYYKKMIGADPCNPLLLGNYARFLEEVRGDFVKAEECCARAILMNPHDGNVLSMYGDLIWRSHKDSARAKTYFDRAVKAAPDDCFVLALHARFLWDLDEEEEDDEEEGEEMPKTSLPNCFHRRPPLPPSLATAY